MKLRHEVERAAFTLLVSGILEPLLRLFGQRVGLVEPLRCGEAGDGELAGSSTGLVLELLEDRPLLCGCLQNCCIVELGEVNFVQLVHREGLALPILDPLVDLDGLVGGVGGSIEAALREVHRRHVQEDTGLPARVAQVLHRRLLLLHGLQALLVLPGDHQRGDHGVQRHGGGALVVALLKGLDRLLRHGEGFAVLSSQQVRLHDGVDGIRLPALAPLELPEQLQGVLGQGQRVAAFPEVQVVLRHHEEAKGLHEARALLPEDGERVLSDLDGLLQLVADDVRVAHQLQRLRLMRLITNGLEDAQRSLRRKARVLLLVPSILRRHDDHLGQRLHLLVAGLDKAALRLLGQPQHLPQLVGLRRFPPAVRELR
mmetsp:Transcript_55877/g.161837  ORF Transcript_55877/g.161837 Transcript_55877/m.161837 type:complete len:371 (+) Transcript_55877:1164-2276(+)